MKNAGKACNNRLYRHIRTFEKIIKNYFVIYITYIVGGDDSAHRIERLAHVISMKWLSCNSKLAKN